MSPQSLPESFRNYVASQLHSFDDFLPILAWCVLNHKDATYARNFITKHRQGISLACVRKWRGRARKWLKLPATNGPISKVRLEPLWKDWREKYGYPTLDDLCNGWSPDHPVNLKKTMSELVASKDNNDEKGQAAGAEESTLEQRLKEVDPVAKSNEKSTLKQFKITDE